MFGLFKSKKAKVTRGDATAEAASEQTERRAKGRANTYADMVAISGNGHNRRRGIVLDLSETGARVRLEAGDNLVDGMTVKIGRYSITRKAVTRWRTRTDLGIEFVN
jgi:hypothetical protein